jgi:uncharacterized protein
MATQNLSSFERIRQGLHQRFEADLLERVQSSLAATVGDGAEAAHHNYAVWLYSCGEAFGYGSRARGDWDGWSDTDLLVVADAQEQADQLADALLDAGLGADVIALSRARWDGMAHSDSPHWQAIRQQARQLLPAP